MLSFDALSVKANVECLIALNKELKITFDKINKIPLDCSHTALTETLIS